jgi:NurA-like 5'-3' nuclease
LLHEVYELALSKAARLREEVEGEAVPEDVVQGCWRAYEPRWRGRAVKLCGVDGGRNYREYRGYVVYVLDAEAVIYVGGEAEEPVRLMDVDVLRPYRYVEERVRIYGEVLELKAALKSIEERGVELALLDGSLISSLSKPLYAERARGLSGIEAFVASLEEVEPTLPGVASKELWPKLRQAYGDKAGRALSFLGGVEKLLLLKRLLSLEGARLAFISKTSRGVDYFASWKPDLALFQEATRGPGHSMPLAVTVGSRVPGKRRLPIHASFFKSLTITLFYARLEDGGPMLRFEVPGRLEEGGVEELLDSLAPYVAGGYPYPLGRAHLDVEVGDDDVERVAQALGLHKVEEVSPVG